MQRRRIIVLGGGCLIYAAGVTDPVAATYGGADMTTEVTPSNGVTYTAWGVFNLYTSETVYVYSPGPGLGGASTSTIPMIIRIMKTLASP